MLLPFELIVIATVIAKCQAFWWSSYPQSNAVENDSQPKRPIPFGYFRSYSYQPMVPIQYQSYYPNYYTPFMQLLPNFPFRKSQNIAKPSETIAESEENSKSQTTSATTATTTIASAPTEPVSMSTTTPFAKKSMLSSLPADKDSTNLINMEPVERRMDQNYFDSSQRIPSWTFRHSNIHAAEQQPAAESQQLKSNAESRAKIQFVPCMCPVSADPAPLPVSHGAAEAEASNRFTENNNVRRFEDLGEMKVEDFTATLY